MSKLRSQRRRSRSRTPDAIHGARVLVVGASPWGAIAAADLACAGASVVRAADDRSAAIARSDLILDCAPADDMQVHRAVARLAHDAQVMSLSASLDGLEAVIGPAVIPGRTACWECARLRRLAHAASPHLGHALHDALLAERFADRARLALPPAAGLLGHDVARAAIELLTRRGAAPIAGSIAVRNLVDLSISLHRVLPMPRCTLCGGARAMPALDALPTDLRQARDPAELRRVLAGIVDPRTGIVGRLTVASQDSPYAIEMPATATAILGAHPGCAFHDHAPEDGSGKGLTALEAMVSAVGEAVERYSARYFDPDQLLRGPVAAMTADHVPPTRLNGYSDSQVAQVGFPYRRLDAQTPIDWALGRWLDTAAPVYLPALLTHYGYPAPPEEAFCQVTSNGLAAGPTLEDASLRAALELIERDAFTLTWLARLPAREIKLDSTIDVATWELDRQLTTDAGRGGRSVLYLLDAGIPVPTILSVVFGDGERWPGATIALAAHPSPRAAIRKALLEQGQAGPYYRRLLEERQKPIPGCPDEVHTLEDHALYYFPKPRAAAFTFLDRGCVSPAAGLPEPEDTSLAAVVRRVTAAGMRIAVVDVTSPDLRSTPFRVVRALGPDFQQIHFGHRLARLDNPRLRALAPHGINPDPHPLD